MKPSVSLYPARRQWLHRATWASAGAAAALACSAAIDLADPSVAKEYVLTDPRVARSAKTTAGFDRNIGKFASLAYLEAEQQTS